MSKNPEDGITVDLEKLRQVKMAAKLASFMRAVRAERERQHTRWGEQTHSFTSSPELRRLLLAVLGRARFESDTKPTWPAIFIEEACEFATEDDAEKRKEELAQVAALCLQMWEKL